MAKLPEILAPAGSLEKLKVACLYGANAVYLGGTHYGLRTAAENFTLPEIEQGVSFAHKLGAKVYVVCNSFMFDQDLETLTNFVQILEKLGVDACIVSDLGAVAAIRSCSNMPLHLSTQSSCVNHESARFWKNQGIQRIVLGRECSIQNAKHIKNLADIEVEMFVHGSMCMAWSGHCVISNYTEGRDANRGGCNYACRFEYTLSDEKKEIYTGSFMSSKDLLGLEHLPEFVEAGVTSLKIEGRMKSPLYVATTTRVYRNALQELTTFPDNTRHHLQTLENIPNRGYTQASLREPAMESSIAEHGYQGHTTNRTRYSGIVIGKREDGTAILHVKNPFEAQDTLEILPFTGNHIPVSCKNMQTVQGESLARSKPNTLVCLPEAKNIELYQVARLVNEQSK